MLSPPLRKVRGRMGHPISWLAKRPLSGWIEGGRLGPMLGLKDSFYF